MIKKCELKPYDASFHIIYIKFKNIHHCYGGSKETGSPTQLLETYIAIISKESILAISIKIYREMPLNQQF